MKNITLETKIFDLLNIDKNIKEVLMDISSKFKKLNKPIIGKTLNEEGATIKEMAIVTGMEPIQLLNKLRKTAGQEMIEIIDSESKIPQKAPEWVLNEPKYTLNANVLLKKDLSPLEESQTILKNLKKDDIFTIESDFRPEPLIDDLINLGHDVYVEKINEEKFITYIKKHMNTAKDFKDAG